MLDILEKVTVWLASGEQVALATVVETWGSAPRQAGAKLAVTSDTAMIGSVSGGCVEGAVVQEMIDSLDDQQPRLLNFGVSDDTAWDVGLACGGKITIYAEPLDPAWWTRIAELVKADQRFVTATVLSGDQVGAKALISDGEVYGSVPFAPEGLADCSATSRQRIADVDVLVEVYQPRPRLIIVGGAHVAMALKQYATILGFNVILIDPRRAFATPERFPDVSLISHQYPDKALAEIGITEGSYIAILTHDPKIDDPALKVALPSTAPYIGVLSSRRTHEKRVERLTKAGVDPVLFERIHTPIGLDINAQTPEEIALAIMAEIIAVKNGKGAS